MADVVVKVKSTFDDKGIQDAEKAAKRLQQQEIQATKAQIAEHRKATQLTAKLDKDLAAERQAQIQQYKDIGAAALTAGGLIAAYSASAISDARESIAAEAQLAAAIQSTGGAAGQSLQALKAHASALQDITNFADEDVERGQALLLTFTNIKTTFPEATKVMLDMSQAMGQDVKSSAIQLGKALNDPIQGISALSRAGVQFTEQQKEQIKVLTEAGDLVGAQRVILAELNKEFGGSAEAARQAMGAQQDLNVSTGELSESWGKLLLAIGDAGVTGALVKFLDTLANGADAWTTTVGQVKELTASMDGLKLQWNLNLEDFGQMAHGMAELNPFVMLKNGVEGFYDSLKAGKGVFASWRAGIESMIDGVGEAISSALTSFTNVGQAANHPAPVSQPAPTSQPTSHPFVAPSSHLAMFQHGGAFTVGGFGGTDSQLVQFLATPGERVSVTPAGGGITINVLGPGGRELAAIMQRHAEAAVSEYHNTVLVPWSNGT